MPLPTCSSSTAQWLLVVLVVACSNSSATRPDGDARDAAATESAADADGDGGDVDPACASAGCFDCGSAARCRNNTEYCDYDVGGASYRCVRVPEACGAMPTCACISVPPPGSCAQIGSGQLHVAHPAP